MLDASLEKGPESSCAAKLMSGKAFVELNLKEVPKLAYMYPKIGIFHTGLTNSILIGKKPSVYRFALKQLNQLKFMIFAISIMNLTSIKSKHNKYQDKRSGMLPGRVQVQFSGILKN